MQHVPKGSSDRWEFRCVQARDGDSDWLPYDEEHQHALRDCYYAKPPKARFRLALWDIDFVQMTQKNVDTGKVRAIRCRAGSDLLPNIDLRGGQAQYQKLVVHFRPVQQGGTDWERLEEKVRMSLPRHSVTKLVEIQNSELREDFDHCRRIVQ
eukprot:SAG11_NODE_10921_length_796_cov_1.035868_1_plen_152_part_01